MSLISLGLTDWDGRNLLSNTSIDGVRLAAALAECLLTLHEGVVLDVSTLARQAQQLTSSLDLLTTFHSERLGCLEGQCFELDWELGELQVHMMELELAWEWWDAQVSLGYVSVEDVVGEGEVIVEEENTGEENFGMDEEQLWSPSSSNRTVLALIPDTSAFPTQVGKWSMMTITWLDTRLRTKNSFGLDTTSPLELVEGVLLQEDANMPHWAWDEGGSSDDQVWQQAISTLRNQDENHHSCAMNNDKSILFQLIQCGVVDMLSFNKNLKGTSPCYAVIHRNDLCSYL
ncbi:hypothetical protein BDM02DRAFT_3193997 [Thelephora ganbajun]|uniref:Uncharacterized protein n=1 Tax=Thelephora ganbajun TaxID=370292 RepID=A0ACB6YY52_THEGA|nr:hypothetical protein BDM02DRAFT_3193997 [Thelephora ganbajun]